MPLWVVLLNSVWATLLLIGLPGAWLMIVTAGAAEWFTPDQTMFHPLTLVLAIALAAGGELLEVLASSKGARQAGATRRGAIGALGGGLLGTLIGTFTIPIPVIGSLIGGATGAFLGSAILEHEGGAEARAVFKIGSGAAAGHVMGMLIKFGAAVSVWLLLGVAAFWP